ncbi:hypothetical protein QVD17_28583 [Tagetes erecta]|uniref:Uncharacterized protein n=1 Tax=Tagetes erecta TaxID=13708 RepID=A0AAD8NSV7_TARER|nr:hypothetical protein QVD17_28583 [Tagetes erecta]
MPKSVSNTLPENFNTNDHSPENEEKLKDFQKKKSESESSEEKANVDIFVETDNRGKFHLNKSEGNKISTIKPISDLKTGSSPKSSAISEEWVVIKAECDRDVYKIDMSQVDPNAETTCFIAHASNDESAPWTPNKTELQKGRISLCLKLPDQCLLMLIFQSHFGTKQFLHHIVQRNKKKIWSLSDDSDDDMDDPSQVYQFLSFCDTSEVQPQVHL